MKNTYINDNSLNNYPFAYGRRMPFPNNVVTSLSVCLLRKTSAQVTAVKASAIEIGSGRVTVSLAVNGSRYVGSLSAEAGGSDTLTFSDADYDVHAVMQAGSLSGVAPASVHCELDLDPSCVTLMDAACIGSQDRMVVAGYVHEIGECLDIQVSGSLQADTPYLDQANGCYVVDIEGWAEVNDGTTVESQITNYPMVTSINGVAIEPSTNYDTALFIKVVPMDGEASGTNTMSRIRLGIVNGLLPEDIRFSGSGTSQDHKVSVDFNDEMGSGTVVTIVGGSAIPNCFGANDDSERPDAGVPVT